MGRVFDRLEELERKVTELARRVYWQQVFLVGLLVITVVVVIITFGGHG